MLGREWLAVGVSREERQRGAKELDGHIRGIALFGVRDNEARRLERHHERLERAPVDAFERSVEATPARDAVDVLGMGRPWERVQLVPRDPDRILDLSRDEEVPGREVGTRDRAGMQNRPLLGQVLARRQARRVVARVDDLSLRSAPEHDSYTSSMELTAMRIARRPRDFVGVRGPDAASYLQAMVSNDVEALGIGGSCEALLLTAKARVIAPLVVLRRGVDDFLLLTEDGLGERVRSTLLRSRFAAKCEIAVEEHTSSVVLGGSGGIPTADYGVPAVEVLDDEVEPSIDDAELEVLRIRAGTPRFGREIDDRVLPAEAGLDQRAVDFEKGCYPGQEPIARQHYRGRVNRTLRGLRIDGRSSRVRRGAGARRQGRRAHHERRA